MAAELKAKCSEIEKLQLELQACKQNETKLDQSWKEKLQVEQQSHAKQLETCNRQHQQLEEDKRALERRCSALREQYLQWMNDLELRYQETLDPNKLMPPNSSTIFEPSPPLSTSSPASLAPLPSLSVPAIASIALSDEGLGQEVMSSNAAPSARKKRSSLRAAKTGGKKKTGGEAEGLQPGMESYFQSSGTPASNSSHNALDGVRAGGLAEAEVRKWRNESETLTEK